jgi:hypothetical protein
MNTHTHARVLADRLDADHFLPEHLEGLADKQLRDALLAVIGQEYKDPYDEHPTSVHASAMAWSLAPANGGHLVALPDLAAGYMVAAVLFYLEDRGPDAVALAQIAGRLSLEQCALADMLSIAVAGGVDRWAFARHVLEAVELAPVTVSA